MNPNKLLKVTSSNNEMLETHVTDQEIINIENKEKEYFTHVRQQQARIKS